METVKVSKALLKRLPVYLQYLKSLPDEVQNISATTIAGALGFGDVQVRKDLAKISNEGRCRTGRSRDQLIVDIERYLEHNVKTPAVVIGAGTLAQALADYGGFEQAGLDVMACFDHRATRKETDTGKPIYTMGRLKGFCRRYDVQIGIIAVSPECAQFACDSLVDCGVQGIWNFTPMQLRTPDGIVVRSEDFLATAGTLRLQVRTREDALQDVTAG